MALGMKMESSEFGRLVRVTTSVVYVVALEDKDSAIKLIQNYVPGDVTVESIGRASSALLKALDLAHGKFKIANHVADL